MIPSRRLRRSAAAIAFTASAAIAAGTASAATPQLLARAASVETTAFDIYFPPQHLGQLEALVAAQVDPHSPSYHKWLSPAQFRKRFGASEAAVSEVEAELHAAGFTVESRSALRLHVVASVGTVERAFDVQLSHGVFEDGTQQLVSDKPLALSATIAAAGGHVAQYTTAPPFHRNLKVGKASPPPNYHSTLGPYMTADIRQAYDFPSVADVNGTGVTIGVLMSGDWNENGVGGPDMADYFSFEFAGAYIPNITTVNIGGGAPFDVNNSAETHLDIQQSSGVALGASVTLYNLPDLSQAMTMAGLEQIDQDNAVDVVNMSFSGAEVNLLAANNKGQDLTWILQIDHSLFLQGNSQGITFVASSGDHGAIPVALNCSSGKCLIKPTLSVGCPPCDPNVTSVGGTNLVTTFTRGSNNSARVSENASPDPLTTTKGEIWGSGGGISVVFAKPTWQKTAVAGFTTPGTGRTVPDLALHMGGCQPGFSGFPSPCPANRSSDTLWIGGSMSPVIGTSASAPDITGLFALMVKLNHGRLGNMNPYIYAEAKAHAAQAFHHSGIVGSNGGPNAHYHVGVPYDLVLGNGTLDVRQFMNATATLHASGPLGDPSNP